MVVCQSLIRWTKNKQNGQYFGALVGFTNDHEEITNIVSPEKVQQDMDHFAYMASKM